RARTPARLCLRHTVPLHIPVGRGSHRSPNDRYRVMTLLGAPPRGEWNTLPLRSEGSRYWVRYTIFSPRPVSFLPVHPARVRVQYRCQWVRYISLRNSQPIATIPKSDIYSFYS